MCVIWLACRVIHFFMRKADFFTLYHSYTATSCMKQLVIICHLCWAADGRQKLVWRDLQQKFSPLLALEIHEWWLNYPAELVRYLAALSDWRTRRLRHLELVDSFGSSLLDGNINKEVGGSQFIIKFVLVGYRHSNADCGSTCRNQVC